VQIHDVDALEDGSAYIVMELCDGHDLETEIALRPGPLPLEEVCAWMLDVCLALADAHAAGIVHRDLKPANVFLSRTATGRTAKVGDFGVSKLSAADDTQTAGGGIVGTPRYMSPEQLRGEVVDARSDIWAAGVILYRLLTGKHAFDGPGAGLALAIMKVAPVPLASVRPDLPPEIVTVVEKALSKNRDARPERAEEIANVLRPFAKTNDSTRGVQRSIEEAAPIAAHSSGDPTRDIQPEPTESPPGVLLEPSIAKPRRGAPLVLALVAIVVVGIIVAVLRGRHSDSPVAAAPPPSAEPVALVTPAISASPSTRASVAEPSASTSATTNKLAPKKRVPSTPSASTPVPAPAPSSTDVPLHL